MSDPYVILGERLAAAIGAHDARQSGAPSPRPHSRGRRANALLLAAVLALIGAAIAVAATGLLTGSPVPEPQGTPQREAGTGVPARGTQLLPLRVADPAGGPPWGIRVVHTTRGEKCVQLGRVQNGQLGQIGVDGAFNDDGRFHALSPSILPNFTNGYANLACVLEGQVLLGSYPSQDRSAEWGVLPSRKQTVDQLRSISYGLLGPHGVSVTYSSEGRLVTVPVSAADGAYLLVRPVEQLARPRTLGGTFSGYVSVRGVGVEPIGDVKALTFRFGSTACSVGRGAPVTRPCPQPQPTPRSAFSPTRSLHEPVRVHTVVQPPAACKAAFLLEPCYKGEVEFKAPYTVASAAAEYLILASGSCPHARPSPWSFEHDVRAGEVVRTRSLGLFNCLEDRFEVRYMNQAGIVAGGPAGGHPSVIVGVGRLGR